MLQVPWRVRQNAPPNTTEIAETKPMTTLAATDNASLKIPPNICNDTANWSLKGQLCQLQDNYGPDMMSVRFVLRAG